MKVSLEDLHSGKVQPKATYYLSCITYLLCKLHLGTSSLKWVRVAQEPNSSREKHFAKPFVVHLICFGNATVTHMPLKSSSATFSFIV